MTWYVASAIISIKKKDGKQKNFPVYENFYLIEADSPDLAMINAINIAKEYVHANDDMYLDDNPAKLVFEGIRKLITISNPPENNIDLDSDPPMTGTELTYSEYLIKSKTQMKRLVQGKAVNLKYIS